MLHMYIVLVIILTITGLPWSLLGCSYLKPNTCIHTVHNTYVWYRIYSFLFRREGWIFWNVWLSSFNSAFPPLARWGYLSGNSVSHTNSHTLAFHLWLSIFALHGWVLHYTSSAWEECIYILWSVCWSELRETHCLNWPHSLIHVYSWRSLCDWAMLLYGGSPSLRTP